MLRRVELRGFKSFANSAALEFGPGVNVIVGPNGSGKSNLAEAIVWSMGEQRATRLRAAGMAEVVFSGGEGRPAAGVAEVRVTVSPADGDPSQAAEIEVSRRVTRAGEATYQLNGTACRLLDVHEALGTVGLGPDALAVIRQGQVEAVCTARPADLRAVLEEAAGVALSRRRRRRAEAKLARVAERLDRARDLVAELARRQATLERQARAATRAAELEEQISLARRRLGTALAASAFRDQQAAGADVAVRVVARDQAAGALDAAGAAHAATDDVLASRVTARDQGRELLRAFQSAAERLRGRADLARERLEDGRRQMARDTHQRTSAATARGDAMQRAQEAQVRLNEATAGAARVRAGLTACAERMIADEARAHTARTVSDDARSSADDARRAVASTEARAGRLAGDLTAATARVARLAGAEVGVETARAERRQEISGERAARWAIRAEAADAAAEDAHAVLAAAEQRRRDLAAAVVALRPSGTPAADVLGSGLEVAPGSERAFGAALGVLADAPAVESVSAADRALDAGAPAVLVPVPQRAAGPRTTAPAGTALIDLVLACETRMRDHLTRVLAGVWLVDDLGEVPEGASGLFVTASGDAWRPAQGVRLRPVSDWAAAAEHRAVSVRLDAAEVALAAAKELRTRAAQAGGAVRARRRAAERAAARAERAVAVARVQAARTSAERADATAALDAASDGIRELESEHRGLAEAAAGADAQLAVAAEVASQAARALEVTRTEHAEVQQAAARAQADLAAAQLAAAEADEQLRLIAGRAQAPALVLDLGGAEQFVAALGRVATALGVQIRAITDASHRTQAAVGAAEQAVAAARASHQEARAVHTQATEALHRAELALAGATARAREIVGSHPVSEEDLAGAVDDPETEVRNIEDLERRRRMIGAVNELAGSEWEETSGRTDEIAEQVADLEAAAADLAAHMQGLDVAVTDGFQQVFAVVSQRFRDAVEVLFPGGQGRLAAVESDDDELGIEIQVVPAGKRARPLAMMSGGERSLVALAFCLAIAMTRPAPFYLLDEVEAALDDTNLRRFLALVRRLSDETQFVMITHQQPTVEIADTLFGVTMGSDGVSQIVSRRLGDDIEGAARPLVRRQLKAIQGGRA